MITVFNDVERIIERLTETGERFADCVWVGREYSKADLLRDLRAIRDAGAGNLSLPPEPAVEAEAAYPPIRPRDAEDVRAIEVSAPDSAPVSMARELT